MLRCALFLSLDECNLCVCWQWDSPATVSKLVVVRENGSALTISVPHTHTLSLWRLWIYFDLRHCVVLSGPPLLFSLQYLVINLAPMRCWRLGRNRSPPAAAASFFFKEEGAAANLSIRIDRSCWRLAMSYIYIKPLPSYCCCDANLVPSRQ